MEKYLPSKRFLIFIAIIAGAGLVFFGINYFIANKENFTSNQKVVKLTNETIGDLFEKDTDGDGLKDWEEVLWGTDTKNKMTYEIPDVQWVENRQKESAAGNQIASRDELGENQTERFSRELYMTLAALETADNIDQTTIYNISAALGEQMFASELPDHFQEVRGGDLTGEEYLQNLINLIEKSGDLGNELMLVNAVIAGEENSEKIIDFAATYKDLANELSLLEVPAEAVSSHLELANNLYKVGVALESMANTTADPLIGLIGLTQYQKYSEKVGENLESLNDIFS